MAEQRSNKNKREPNRELKGVAICRHRHGLSRFLDAIVLAIVKPSNCFHAQIKTLIIKAFIITAVYPR